MSVATVGAPLMADNHGPSGRPMAARTAGTRNGSRSTGLQAAWATVSNTNFGRNFLRASSADSADPPTPVPHGRVRSVSLTLLNGDHSTWPAMATFTLVAVIVAALFGVFARLMRKTQMSLPLSTRSRQSTWAAAWFTAVR